MLYTNGDLIVKLRESCVFERWNNVLSYSTAFDLIAGLSEQVRRFLCRPDRYFYFRDALSETLDSIRNGSLAATQEDVRKIHRMARDLLSGEYSKFINCTDPIDF